MGKEKILVVDSDEQARSILLDCLNGEYEVFTTVTCSEALEMSKKDLFSVVMTEVGTQEEKGVDVIRKFKEVNSDIEVIVITTHKSVPLAIEAMKKGAYDYITKPFNLDELKIVVQHALERQKLIEEVREKEAYQELALLDGLTGIYNRRYFDEILHREVERAVRYPQKFSLLMIDIDDFKKYNDIYGHQAGDKVLKEVAQTIYYRTRNIDFAARYGGEEFVIITPHTEKESAAALASRVLGLVSDKDFFLEGDTAVKVTLSIGVATFGDDSDTEEGLVNAADKALYQAKKLGKNRVCLFGAPLVTEGKV